VFCEKTAFGCSFIIASFSGPVRDSTGYSSVLCNLLNFELLNVSNREEAGEIGIGISLSSILILSLKLLAIINLFFLNIRTC
jgi:hypothetical protein